MSSPTPVSSPSEAAPSSVRILSIDVLRGFDMFWIVGGKKVVALAVVLLAGSVPEWFSHQTRHVEWIGFSAWDLIMPLFLFVVGAAMPLAFDKRVAQGQSRHTLHLRVLRRFVVLFILGMIAQGHLFEYDLSTLKLYNNTLQAIACGYAVSALLILNLHWSLQILATAALLVGYWALVMFVPFAGRPAGTLQPDANLALWIDQLILGRFRDENAYTWILSSMTFAATVMLGVFAGRVVQWRASNAAKVSALVALAVACLAGGWGWSLYFPIIKHLWTSSMVLWAAGWSYLLLAVLFLVIDVWGFRGWAFPFIVLGSNAIVAYMAVEVFDFRHIGDIVVGNLASRMGDAGELLRATAALVVVWLILFYLYRKKTFVRV